MGRPDRPEWETIYMVELYSPSWAAGRWIGYSHSPNKDAMLQELDKAKQSYRGAHLVEYRLVKVVA